MGYMGQDTGFAAVYASATQLTIRPRESERTHIFACSTVQGTRHSVATPSQADVQFPHCQVKRVACGNHQIDLPAQVGAALLHQVAKGTSRLHKRHAVALVHARGMFSLL